MIVYFDTSAFLPLIVHEAGTQISARLWSEAEQVVSSQLVVVETAAAVSKGKRMGRIDAEDEPLIQEYAWRMVSQLTLIEAFGLVIDDAAHLARTHGLRGYDAMHLATARKIQARNVLFASGDRGLLAAASSEGFATIDTGTIAPVS